MPCQPGAKPIRADTSILRSSRSCANSASTSLTAARNVSPAELAEQADVVITMGCGDACPFIPGKRYIDWELDDPNGRPVDEVRATRDDIARRVQELVADLDRTAAVIKQR